MTEMACADELMAQDRWLAALLGTRPSWQLSGPHLRISVGGTAIDLTDRRMLDADRPLLGTQCSASQERLLAAPRPRGIVGPLLPFYGQRRSIAALIQDSRSRR
jgi:hypothetical protein